MTSLYMCNYRFQALPLIQWAQSYHEVVVLLLNYLSLLPVFQPNKPSNLFTLSGCLCDESCLSNSSGISISLCRDSAAILAAARCPALTFLVACAEFAQEKGLWPLMKLVVRTVLAEGAQFTKTVYLAGSGLGGSHAALISMWLKHLGGRFQR